MLSQNAQQATFIDHGRKKYSYSLYDKQGRITEAGELLTNATVNPDNTATDSWVQTNVVANTDKTQITRTYYDIAPTWQTALGIPNFSPTNLRNRVAATCYYETYPANPEDYNHATHYTYDVLGNVHQLVQDIPQLEAMGQRYKQIFYNYDLASGNVNLVSYQPGAVDQFYHYYEYDADNRITDVRTARNPAINDLSTTLKMTVALPEFNPSMGWQKDAKYLYYLHGPLARMELGQNQVQGTDYSYTLHGWLKAINDGLMQNAHDPGLDGNATVGNANRWFGRDAAAIELGYYKSNAASTIEDYTAIGNNGHISGKTGSNFGESTVSLYNGNIGSMVTTLADKTQLSTNNVVQASSRGAVYQYDQLNRIRESWSFTNTDVPNYQWNNNLSPGTIPQEWLTQYTYDAMGNLETLKRQGGTGATDMDQLTYNYDYGTPTWKNQLLHVDDSKAAGLHTEDIDDQAANNYTYDEIGNLVADVAEEIQDIEWTVYGKIKKITRTGASTKPNLEFEYNTAGQRVVKKVVPNNGDNPTITYYVRDASGNIMATYKHYYEIIDIPSGAAEERLAVEEFDIYGSSRLGILNKEVLVAYRVGIYTGGTFIPGIPDTYTIAGPLDFELANEQVGYKNYELSNHLGNVLATITDRKVPFVNGSSYDYFNAQIVSMTDYYPFGMQIEERSWTAPSNKYRFGFNGKEQDKEGMGGGQSTYDYGFRIYNPAIAKFLSVDPLASSYPWNSTYSFAENRVIDAIDLDGLETLIVGKESSYGAGIAIGAGGGIIVAPNGVFGYGTWDIGFQSSAGFNVAARVTFFPLMKRAQEAGGIGWSLEATWNVGIWTYSAGVAQSGEQVGVTFSSGYGLSWPPAPIGVQGSRSETGLRPLITVNEKKEAIKFLQEAKIKVFTDQVNPILYEIQKLERQRLGLAKDASELLTLKGSYITEQRRTGIDYSEDINNAQNAINELNEKIDALTTKIEKLDKAKDKAFDSYNNINNAIIDLQKDVDKKK